MNKVIFCKCFRNRLLQDAWSGLVNKHNLHYYDNRNPHYLNIVLNIGANIWIQLHGVPAHNTIPYFLNLLNKWISSGGPISWPKLEVGATSTNSSPISFV